jgi:hypothetical protein
VIDTAKAANLCVKPRIHVVPKLTDRNRFTVYEHADLMDFINAPVGKGLPITQTLRPLIAGKQCPSDVQIRSQPKRFVFQSLPRLEQVRKQQVQPS